MEFYSRARARRALFHTLGLRVTSQLAAVFGVLVLVRYMSEQSLGVFNLLYSIIPVIGTLASLGLDQVLKRFQPEYLQAGNIAAARPASIPSSGGVLTVNKSMECGRLHGFLLPFSTT